jgi:hypothetical protein
MTEPTRTHPGQIPGSYRSGRLATAAVVSAALLGVFFGGGLEAVLEFGGWAGQQWRESIDWWRRTLLP